MRHFPNPRRVLAPLLPWVVAAMLFGCAGTEVGNPGEEADVTLQFAALTDEARPGALVLDDGTRIDEAWLVIAELELRSASRCESGGDGGDGELDELALGPFVVELVSGLELPRAPMLSPLTRSFCRLELDLAPPEDDTILPAFAPAALARRSVLVRGRRADGVAFELSGNLDAQLHLEAASAEPFSLAAGREPLLIGFALSSWVAAAELDAIEGEDPIRIDHETNHPERFEAFEDAFRRSARLLRDANDDGTIDPDELDEVLATGDL